MINFNSLSDEGGFKLLEDGEYLCRCESAEVKSSANGNEYINIKWAAYKNSPTTPEGKFFDNVMEANENSAPLIQRKLKEFMRATHTEQFTSLRDISKILVGKEVWINVTSKEFNGRTSNCTSINGDYIYAAADTAPKEAAMTASDGNPFMQGLNNEADSNY